MALCAWNVPVLPVEFECCSIMIEVVDLPLIKSMTFHAISNAFNFKLFKMVIRMAIYTG